MLVLLELGQFMSFTWLNQKLNFKFIYFINRVDAAKHIWPKDLAIIYSRLHNLSTEHDFPAGARPYIYQEVIDMGSEVISKYEYNSLGAVTEFKYGLELSRGIRGENPLKWFKNIGEEWGLLSRKDALIFIDNHDTQRSHNGVTAVLTHKEARLYKMAVAFMLAHPYGNPRVMSSFAFDDFDQGPPADVNGNILTPIGDNNSIRCADGWICEHRWSQIVNMVGFRNTVAGTEICEWWDNWNNQIAFSRGNRGFIAINAEKYDLNKRIKTCLPEGTYCDIISGDLVGDGCTGKRLIVDINGFANVNIVISDQDQVVAFHINVSLFIYYCFNYLLLYLLIFSGENKLKWILKEVTLINFFNMYYSKSIRFRYFIQI